MNGLDSVVNNNLNNKNRFHDAIAYEPKFDSRYSLSENPYMDPQTVLTVSLRGDKKNRETINYDLIAELPTSLLR